MGEETVKKPVYSELYLPSLKSVSDTPSENEYITFPGMTFLVYSKEPSTKKGELLYESAVLKEKCTPQVKAIWIGLTDFTGSTSTNRTLRFVSTKSGGKRRNKITRKYKK